MKAKRLGLNLFFLSWLLVMLHKVTYKSAIADTTRLEQHRVNCFTLEFVLPLSKIKLNH